MECVIADLHENFMGIEGRAGLEERTQMRACSTLADRVIFPPEGNVLGVTVKLITFGATGRTLTVTARPISNPPRPDTERWKV
jgi:RNase P/RNase MRP subunit p29